MAVVVEETLLDLAVVAFSFDLVRKMVLVKIVFLVQGQAIRGYFFEEGVLFAGVEECQEYVNGRKHNNVNGLIIDLVA